MIKIVSNNFKKVSENQLKSIAEECRKLIGTLNSSGKRLSAHAQFSGGTPKTYNNPWLCVVKESENTQNIEAISALRNTLLEAVNYFQNNSNVKNVNVKTLASGPALIEQMRKMAF